MMRTETLLLTVVVPTTKVGNQIDYLAKWLFETIDLPMETIIVHDITDNESSEIIRSLLTKVNNPRIKSIEGSFDGPGNARNAGMLMAKGNWIAFWDSDDSPNPKSAIDLLLRIRTIHPVICTNYEIKNLRKNRVFQKWLPKNDIELVIQGGVWRFFFKKDFLTNAKFGQFRMGEDYLFLARLGLSEYNSVQENVVTYQYITGHAFQLTNDALAISELSKTIRELENEKLHKNGNRVTFLIYLRLCYSLLLNGNAAEKRQCALKFFAVIFATNSLSRIHRFSMAFKLARGLVGARS
jgi:glycosyltransferase involved in cell wall biosynthesis